MTALQQTAAAIVDAIIVNLADRRGLGHEWTGIDISIQQEIREAWQKIVVTELTK